MNRYADGDDRAFADVYDGLAPPLYAFLSRLTRNETAAEDLLQQTFLRIHDARGRFVPGSEVEPWAYAIARRLFLDWYRRTRRERDHEPLDASYDELITNEPDAEATLVARQLAGALARQLDRLPPQQREAFVLVRQEGLSIAQAAEVLGTTITAVKLRAHRAYEGLRLALEGTDDEEGKS